MKRTPESFLHDTSLVLRRAISIGIFLILVAAPAFAQEAGGDIADSPTGVVFRWLNFAIVAGIILYFFVKVAAPHFRSRSEEISRKIAEGARAREAADQQRAAAQQNFGAASSDRVYRGGRTAAPVC